MSFVGWPFSKNIRLVPIEAYGLNTELGRRTMVWRLHSSIRCSLSRVFTPSPNRLPSGSTTAARPPDFKIRIMSGISEAMLSARATLQAEYEKLHKAVLAIVREDAVCRRLMTVPGVGPVVAVTFKSAVDDPSRIAKSKA